MDLRSPCLLVSVRMTLRLSIVILPSSSRFISILCALHPVNADGVSDGSIRTVLPESSQKWPILGLYMLSLLASSRIADFHTELELLPIASHSNKFIAYPIALEQELMEGSYRSL